MTREEAKQTIREMCKRYIFMLDEDEAIDMAIEALTQPIVAKCYEIEKDHIYCSPETAEEVCDALHLYHNRNVQNMHKGKWINKQVFNHELDKYVSFIECSVCGYEPYYGGSESKFNYCANCGADMRGESNEND